MSQLHRDRKQAVRMRRILLGLGAYAMWMAVGLYLYRYGLLEIGLTTLLAYFALMLANNAVFLALVRGNWNLHFRDPGMTFAQIACGILWGMLLIAQADISARGSMLLVFVTGFFFGVFRLTMREFLVLMLLASGSYALMMFLEWQTHSPATRQLEITRWLFLTLMLSWMSLMGSYVARLRANLHRAFTRIEELANRDHLTGTRNRRAITGNLETALTEAAENATPLSICILDLDHFKRVNDRYGHLVGDEILQQVVQRIEQTLRSDDILHNANFRRDGDTSPLGRFGGEEFLLVLPGTNLEGAERAAERVRRLIAERDFPTQAGPIPVHVSIGVSGYRPGDSVDSLIARADRALYEGKRGGRNRVAVQH